MLIDELPGNPDNINRASDGTYWLALVGIRTPTFDLAARKPGFRLRMVKQVPTDEWLAPALNHGCVLKFNEAGEALEFILGSNGYFALDADFDAGTQRLSLSRRTRKQPHWPHQAGHRRSGMDGLRCVLGIEKQGCRIADVGMFDHFLRDVRNVINRDGEQNAIPPLDGAFSPNDRLDACTPIGDPLPGLDDVVADNAGAIYVSAGRSVLKLSGAGI